LPQRELGAAAPPPSSGGAPSGPAVDPATGGAAGDVPDAAVPVARAADAELGRPAPPLLPGLDASECTAAEPCDGQDPHSRIPA